MSTPERPLRALSTADPEGDATRPDAEVQTAPDPARTLPEAPTDDAPSDVGRRVLGRGGIGLVMAVWDAALGREVARKTLIAGARHPTHTARFLREARVTARLQHPGVVPVYALGSTDEGAPYYTMKIVRGRTLASAIEARPELADRLELLGPFIAICQALAYAHSQGVIHRDLKPANVMVGEFGETVVLDWGLARVQGVEDTPHGPPTPTPQGEGLTVAGAVLGTPAYMSPEQARGEPVGPATDLYGLGAMLYELVAGRAPFRGLPVEGVVARLKQGETPRISEVAPRAPPELRAIVDRALAPLPEDRYPDAAALAADVEAFRTHGVVSAYRYSPLDRLRALIARNRRSFRVGVAGLIGVLAVGLVGGLRVVAERDRAQQAEREAVLRAEQALSNLADALSEKAVATPEISPFTARIYAAGALAMGERPAARGVLARAGRQWAPALEAQWATPEPCRSVAWAQAVLLCLGEQTLYGLQDGVARFVAPLGARPTRAEIALSADGALAALLTEGPAMVVLSTATGAERHRWSLPTDAPTRELLFSQDGAVLYTAHADGLAGQGLRAWDVQSGAEIARSQTLLYAHDLALGPGGGLWATLRGLQGYAHAGVVELSPDTLEVRAYHETASPPGSLAWSPDLRTLAVSAGDGTTYVWAADQLEVPPRLLEAPGTIGDLSWSPDGRLLLDRRESGDVTLWRSRTWRAQLQFKLPQRQWHVLAMSPDGDRYAAASAHGLSIWRMDGLPDGDLIDEPGQLGASPKFPADDAFLFTSQATELELWTRAGALLRKVPVRTGFHDARLAPDGRAAIRPDEAGAALIDLATGAERRLSAEPHSWAAFADHGRTMLLLETSGALSGWDRDGHEPRWTNRGHGGYAYLFGGDEPVALLFANDDQVVLVDTRDGRDRALTDGSRVYYGGLSRNGRWAVLTLRDGTVTAYDTRSGAEVARVRPWEGQNPRVAMSDDGRLIAAGGADSVVRLWDREQDRLVAELRGHRQRMQDLSFSADGLLLVSTTWGMELRTWDLRDLWTPGPELLARAERESGLRLEGVRVVEAPP